MNMTVQNIDNMLRKFGNDRLDEFMAQGHAAAGCNGPYRAEDTPVRNTAHWLIIYTYLWKRTGDNRYRQISRIFCDYLMEEQGKTISGAIMCMSDAGADHLNGLIGQAWVIEALVYAYEAYRDERLLDCAIRIFHSQKFVEKTGMWCRVEIDGTELGYDLTLNHQLWFCLAGLLLLRWRDAPDISAETERHLACVRKEYFGVHPDGLIRHYGAMRLTNRVFSKFYIKQRIKQLLQRLKLLGEGMINSREQEEGYHMFELYGYARLSELKPKEPLFQTEPFQKAVGYGMQIDRLNRILGVSFDGQEMHSLNRYAYGYNSPAYEYPLVQIRLQGKNDDTVIEKLLDMHMKLTFSSDNNRFCRNNSDPETLMARLYELIPYCENIQRNTN